MQTKEHPEPQNHALVYVPNWQDKLRRIFFPYKHLDYPEMPSAKDGVITEVQAFLSIQDRLRILFSGRCRVKVITSCENVVGANLTVSNFQAMPPKWMDRAETQG